MKEEENVDLGEFVDITGNKFGKWTVVKRTSNNSYGGSRWYCECECGGKSVVDLGNLRSGKSKSCGCSYVSPNKTHDKSDTRIYNIYLSMKRRCYYEKDTNYKRYGARGIIVCEEWLDRESGFMNFYNWSMENGYQEDLSIDRIEVNGNYEPSNCRWTTNKIQGNNKRNNIRIDIDGSTKTITEWSDEFNINRDTVYRRFQDGVRGKDLFKPIVIRKSEIQSGVKGVTWNKELSKWAVGVYVADDEGRKGKKRLHIGFFEDLESAIEAKNTYDIMKKEGEHDSNRN